MADDELKPDDEAAEVVPAEPEPPEPAEPVELAEPPEPRPRLTWLTLTLLILNLLAAPAFLVLLFMDYRVRQDWSYATFRHELALWGLPLKDEAKEPAAREGRPRLRLDPEQIKKAYSTPGRAAKAGGLTFAPVEERPDFPILPDMMTDEVKKEVFKGLGPPVGTLDEEIDRLRKAVPRDIDRAAEGVADAQASDADKRKAVQTVLLSLAWSTDQVDALERQIKAAQGDELRKLLVDAVQRRLYVDFLAPANLFRVGDVESFTVEKAADLKNATVEQLQELTDKRLAAAVASPFDPTTYFGKDLTATKQDSLEKRQKIAFLLFDLAQVRVPLGNERLYPQGVQRAQAVVGLHDLSMAASHYVRSLHVLEGRVLDNLRFDRSDFVDHYKQEIERLKELVKEIQTQEERLADLKGQQERFQKVEEARTRQLKEATEKLVKAREDTATALKELREFQQQFFQAELNLSNAAEQNFVLENNIRKLQARLRGSASP